MFEVGKLNDESLDSFLTELGKVSQWTRWNASLRWPCTLFYLAIVTACLLWLHLMVMWVIFP